MSSSSSKAISRILVPIDGSENASRAASYAVGVAAKYGAELHVIHVLEMNPNLAAMGVYGLSPAEEVARMQDEASRQVGVWFDKIRKEADGVGIKMESKIIAEFPLSLVGEIVNYAEHNGVDLVVMGSRGRTGFKKLLLGSVASGVVTYAPCPVLIVK
jgi:nucleotide-binding universal stress UspA family protein